MDAENTYEATRFLQAIVERLEPRAAQIDQLRNQGDVRKVVVRLNAYIEPDKEAAPGVYIDHQLLDRLTKLNVDLEFDFTLLAPED
jgi:hypothetical protein